MECSALGKKLPVPVISGTGPVKKTIYSSSYGGFFSIFSYAYASQFYDAYAFYHKAYENSFFVKK